MAKTFKSMDEFYTEYMPRRGMRVREEAKLKSEKVCPECSCRVVVYNEYETFGYLLCYACGWSSMTPYEIGQAMAKESSRKLKLNLNLG